MSDKKAEQAAQGSLEGMVSLNTCSLASEKKVPAWRMGDLYLEPAPLRHLAGNYYMELPGQHRRQGEAMLLREHPEPEPSGPAAAQLLQLQPPRRPPWVQGCWKCRKMASEAQGPCPGSIADGREKGRCDSPGTTPKEAEMW